jgi:hypothetical protein
MDANAGPVVLINLFEVPAEADDRFIAAWDQVPVEVRTGDHPVDPPDRRAAGLACLDRQDDGDLGHPCLSAASE